MADRHGPYRSMRFLLEFDSIVKAGFARCRLPETTTDVIEYREGNDRPTPRQLAGLNRYSRLILESGVTDDSIELFEWRQRVERGQLDEARMSGAIVLLSEEGEPGPRWEFQRGWPASYVAPTLAADGEDVAIERLELVLERFERIE